MFWPKQQGLRLLHNIAVVLAVLCATPWSATWAATSAAILQRPYPYVIIEQDLRDVLIEFGRNIGVATEISKKVSGVVRGRAQRGDTAQSFLQRIGTDHDLVWYLDRDTLFVSTQQDNTTKALSLAQVSMKPRLEVIKEWSEKGEGVQVVLDEQSDALVVTGPSGFQERVASAISALRVPSIGGPTGTSVVVFRGASGSQHIAVPR